MPHTTETTTVEGDQRQLFAAVADFSRLADWDPTFIRSERTDDGALDVGATFDCLLTILDVQVPMALQITRFEAPDRVELEGTGDGFRTHEEIVLAPNIGDRVEVTYTSQFDTDNPDWVDALGQPVFLLAGKAAIRGLQDHLQETAHQP